MPEGGFGSRGRRRQKSRRTNVVYAEWVPNGMAMVEGVSLPGHVVLVRRKSRGNEIVRDQEGGPLSGRFFSRPDALLQIGQFVARGILLPRQAKYFFENKAYWQLPNADGRRVQYLREAFNDPALHQQIAAASLPER